MVNLSAGRRAVGQIAFSGPGRASAGVEGTGMFGGRTGVARHLNRPGFYFRRGFLAGDAAKNHMDAR
jgi:hypothetical protein